MRLTVTPAGVEYRFAPMLHKRTYAGDTDWKVWHYCGDFPLNQPGVETEVEEIMRRGQQRLVLRRWMPQRLVLRRVRPGNADLFSPTPSASLAQKSCSGESLCG